MPILDLSCQVLELLPQFTHIMGAFWQEKGGINFLGVYPLYVADIELQFILIALYPGADAHHIIDAEALIKLQSPLPDASLSFPGLITKTNSEKGITATGFSQSLGLDQEATDEPLILLKICNKALFFH